MDARSPLLRERGRGEGLRAKRASASGWLPHLALRATFSRREKEGAAGRSQSALESNHLPRPDAFVGGEDDAQRIDRVLEMLAEIDLAADRFEEQALLALAELLMARLVLCRFDLVGMREGAVGFETGMMDAQ